MASTLRTFIAIPIPAATGRVLNRYAAALSRQFPEYRWNQSAEWHVTVNFLGDVADRLVPEVCQAVTQVVSDVAPIRCRLDQLGAFPKPTRPRILWLGIGTGQESLVRLHYRLDEALETLGIEPERKRYRPHLTLARLHSGARWSDAMVDELKQPEVSVLRQPVDIDVDEVVVYSSHLEFDGAVHTPMCHAALTGN